ncbi:hypothetical protein JAAARDRAFT_347429 [Jaapia argillacea MUCL 33604]|uniref:Uncharacterized protein n=1 Tax=Jaapia argillacea MUCL 33604 TaxID=933084 RepID=A0A067PWM8_9AGAM|nr:hypothetical protein JAAARDRAFT_347429 [Jaapia argillacea MUCL 33604]
MEMSYHDPEPISDVGGFVDSPVSLMDVQAEIPLPAGGSSQLIPPPVKSAVEMETEQFLAQIMPAELAAPMVEEALLEESSYAAPPLKAAVKPGALPKIQKKWKWSGKLLVEFNADQTTELCDITISDPTDPIPGCLKLSICFNSADHIRFRKLHDIADLNAILPACTTVAQAAKVGPQEASDLDAIQTLAKYMDNRNLITFAAMSVNDETVGILLVFSSVTGSLSNRFKVPADLRDTGLLVAVLLPWRLPSDNYSKLEWVRSHSSLSKDPIDISRLITSPLPHSRLHLAVARSIHLLQFPKWLLDHMSVQPPRPYCVWWTPADGSTTHKGFETNALKTLMRHCGAKDVGHKADVRVVFIHIGALTTLCKLPALVERRCKRPEIQFITYGSHESVPPEQWGVREIYPLGGIVTFTPSALLQTPFGAFKLMRQLAEHPLWECYILPSVLGFIIKHQCGDGDPASLLNDNEFMHLDLIEMIEEGEISLIDAPSLNRRWSTDTNSEGLYRRPQAHLTDLLPMKAADRLRFSVQAFTARYANVPPARLASNLEGDISRDLSNMQTQPAIMAEYRRYVIIKGPSDDHLPWDKDV